jgi:hypothetical protein
MLRTSLARATAPQICLLLGFLSPTHNQTAAQAHKHNLHEDFCRLSQLVQVMGAAAPLTISSTTQHMHYYFGHGPHPSATCPNPLPTPTSNVGYQGPPQAREQARQHCFTASNSEPWTKPLPSKCRALHTIIVIAPLLLIGRPTSRTCDSSMFFSLNPCITSVTPCTDLQ